MNQFCAQFPRDAFSVLLAAWPPSAEHDDRPALVSPELRQEAIVAAARVVFALGGSLLVSGDSAVAPVLAAVALDYAAPLVTERAGESHAPLTVVESGGWDPTLRALLAPYLRRGVLRYLDAEGRPWTTEDRSEDFADAHLEGYRRHPLRPWMIEHFRPLGAVFISPPGEAQGDLEMLLGYSVEVAVLTETAPDAGDAERWRGFDPMEKLVGDVPLDRWSERDRERHWLEEERELGPADARAPVPQPVMPYAFALQRLVAQWWRRDG